MIIYVAGPISNGEVIGREGWLPNIKRACEEGAKIMKLGHTAIVPHLAYHLEEHAETEFDYETWMRADFNLIEASDALYRMQGNSRGADREVAHAQNLGKLVFFNLDEIPHEL